MDIPLLPQPTLSMTDDYVVFDLVDEVENYNRGVWDAVTASCPDVKVIDSECSDYQAGFVAGLKYRFESKTGQQQAA